MIINQNGSIANGELDENVDIQTTEENEDGSITSEPNEDVIDNNNEEGTTEDIQDKSETDSEKIYTEEEFNQRLEEKLNEIIPKRLNRRAKKIEDQYKKKYANLENMLKFGFNTNSAEEAEQKMQAFYEEKGYTVPTETNYEIEDKEYAEFKAKKEAQAIIDLGYDEIKAETDALCSIESEQMTQHDKLLLQILGNERIRIESEKELAKAGITKKDLDNPEFIEFSKMLNSSMSDLEKYQTYLKFKPHTESEKIEKIGDMKSNTQSVNKYKDFYTPEEARKLTSEDLDNPEIMTAVERSMEKWEADKVK